MTRIEGKMTDAATIPDDLHPAICERLKCPNHGTFMHYAANRTRETDQRCPQCQSQVAVTGVSRAWTARELPYFTEPKPMTGVAPWVTLKFEEFTLPE
jgi:hypothetical protein